MAYACGVSGTADERWNARIRRAIPLVDALIWTAIAVGAVILVTYLIEEQWGDAAEYLKSATDAGGSDPAQGATGGGGGGHLQG